MKKFELSPWQLALLSALFIVVANNNALFGTLVTSLDLLSIEGIGFIVAITSLMIFVLTAIFLITGIGLLNKIVITIFLVVTSALGYFSNEMGIIFNEEMMLNIADTIGERNSAEAFELVSPQFITHVLLFGIAPALLVGFVKVVPRRILAELATRVSVLVAGAVLIGCIILPNYRYISYFSREHSALQQKITPIYPIMSLVRVTRDHLKSQKPFKVIDASATQRRSGRKRTIGVMVVGETARADHFSLNGYSKQTNPLLANRAGVLFGNASSCGTSTLFSVPCMFSIRGRSTYDIDDASSESNVLDILTAAGINTVWIDNNSTCKNVCNRIENLNLRENPNKSSEFYGESGYYDEVLVDALDEYLDTEGPDTLIVLHTLGSHGPAYSRRYPDRFGVFQPFCDQPSPTDCSSAEVINAYDNTILYTDYVLDKVIEKLDGRAKEFDSFLFYASDHGESLGENGVYLHGLPYRIAPAAQTDVPVILWTSFGFRNNHRIDRLAMADITNQQLSHDNISHTLMGLYDIDATTYQRELDMFANARMTSGSTAASP